MEHLVDPSELPNLKASLPPTSWLDFDHDNQEYPLVPFSEYPLQRGWTAEQLHSLRLGSFRDTNPASALAMLQSWLFFGLLESAFQERFSSRHFIFDKAEKETSGSRVLNTAYLRTYYQQWHLSFMDLTPERQASLSRSFASSLHGPRDWALYLTVKLGPRTPEYTTPPLSTALNATIRTTLLLLELLGKAVPQGFAQNGFVNTQMDLDPGHEISEAMRARKWCPSSCKVLMNKYGPSVAMYATLLEPSENSWVKHDGCERGRCVAYDVDVPSYEPRHYRDGCSCEKIGPPAEDVYAALRSETFPLLDGTALLNDDDKGDLSVTPHKPGTQFLAFSHVWSDGLGSATEKGLPRCQIAYLSKLTAVITGSPIFWLDALCIPSDPSTRTAAIHAMAATYASASTTLVLDTGLRKTSISSPLEELILRILASTWMRRLWTLQEGALAGNLIFLLRDAFLSLPEVFSRIFAAGFSGPIAAAGLAELAGFNRKIYESRPAHINHIQRLTGYRSSSRFDDETLAIAPLFHIDVKILTPHKGERRKVEFWNALGKVPTGIIFSDADRLTTAGYRWAPDKLMHGDANIFGPGKGQVTSTGLTGEFMLLEMRTQLRVEAKGSYGVLDVGERRAFRVFDQRDLKPEEEGFDHSTVCDALAVRTQPTGELVPGVAVALVRNEEDEEGVVGYQYEGKLMIVMDEFVELVDWDDLPGDSSIARSGMRKIRIS